MTARTPMPIFVVNLDRAVDRWRDVERAAAEHGLDVERIAAVDGAAVAEADWIDVDHARFRRYHGRIVLPGEYGCYRSHLQALDAVIASNAPAAIIAEDDVVLGSGLMDRVQSVLREKPDLDALKLVNHRLLGFIAHGRSSMGDAFGRCLHGPQGSAACYAVTRAGARKLRQALETMWLPYDVALERGWETGTSILTVRADLVRFSPHRKTSSISTRIEGGYRKSKPHALMRLPAAAFRSTDYLQRMAYALR